ncbi:MAG: glycoside hydrolase family 78 protein [Treponema sp.]|jgi:alpha-L-rhamnosidase|nr:glycoside hydrolase family 78 protein [Treponema sp.]
MIKAVQLRTEYRENPLGLYTGTPRFGWKIESDKQNVLQGAYSLQISSFGDFHAELWESGKIDSGESQFVSCKGLSFASFEKKFWRVKIWDNLGEESPWSESAWFEVSMLKQDEWKAVFISAEDENAGAVSEGTALRREFNLSKKIKSARLYASAKGIYEAWCNGTRAGDERLTPGFTEYGSRILFRTFDVTAALKQGPNALGFMVGPGWYKGDMAGWMGNRNCFGTRTAIIAQLRVVYEDDTVELVCSDGNWKCNKAPVLYSEIYHGEVYDAQKEERGWSEAGFTEQGWKPVYIESNDISMLRAADGLPVKEQEHFKALSLFTTPGGDRVIDFGQNISGYVRFTVSGKAGDRVKIRHAEILDAQGNFYTENLRKARQTIEYSLRGGGAESYSPHFTFQGFRYIAVDEWPGNLDMNSFEAIAVYSDMRPTGSFTSSSELLNRFVINTAWSMKDNFVDIPTDCPQRDERLGWTGDAQIFCRSASFLMEAAPFFRKWLRDVAVSQLPDGRVPHVVPNVLKGYQHGDSEQDEPAGATAWADAEVIIPWTMYRYFGDRAILEEQYPSMKKWVDYIRGVAEGGTLFNTGFHFGDWVALDAKEGSYLGATPNDLSATAFYAYSTELLSKSAALLGKKEDAETYEKLHRKIAASFGEEFFSPRGRIAARTQTACILSLYFDLCPPHARKRTLDTLVELLKENTNHLTTGFLGTPFACRVLADNGRPDLAYELLSKEDFPSWLYQVTKGATTIWEHWDGLKPDGTMWSADMNSFNHYAYGAVCDWIFSSVGGLDTDSDAVGFKKALIKPLPGGPLAWAETNYESAYGLFSVRWEKSDNGLKVDVKAPHNTTALLILPEAKAGTMGGIEFSPAEGGARAELGSGEYSFSYLYKGQA